MVTNYKKITEQGLNQIEKTKKALIKGAKKHGIYEDFGQDMVEIYKVLYGYNPYGTKEERDLAKALDDFDQWCQNFDLSQIK